MARVELLRKLALRISWILIPLAVGIVVVALTLMFLGGRHLPSYAMLSLTFVFGAVMWYFGYLLGHRRRFYFAATFMFLTAGLLLLLEIGMLSLPPRNVWPFLTLFIGISFMVAGHVRFDRFHPAYAVPAVAFTGLGFLFLLFSTDIIPFSFGSVVLWWSPVIFLPMVISVVLWLYRRNKTPQP